MLNDLYQMLDPVAFSAGPITIYWYGLAYVFGAILTGVVMYRTQKRWGFDISVDDLMTVVIGVVFGLLIGARLFYIVFYGEGYYFEHPLEILAWREVYTFLEYCVDSVEHVADTVGSIVMKNS